MQGVARATIADESSVALPTQPFRDEHAELIGHVEHLRTVARELAPLTPKERKAKLGPILGFLRETLIPHASAEEEVLYPEWARLVGSPSAAAPMIHDHEAIVARVDALQQTDPGDLDRLHELLYGLYALISVHFRKEEDIQLPAFDAEPDVARHMIERMGERIEHQH